MFANSTIQSVTRILVCVLGTSLTLGAAAFSVVVPPTSVSGAWTFVLNAIGSDDDRAFGIALPRSGSGLPPVGPGDPPYATDLLVFTGFDFSEIPADSIIEGVEVSVEGSATESADPNWFSGATTGNNVTPSNYDNYTFMQPHTGFFPTTSSEMPLDVGGTPSDKWSSGNLSAPLTLEALNDPDFALSLGGMDTVPGTVFEVDDVFLTVHFSDVCGADTESPVITVLGDNPVSIEVDSIYEDAGATAFDNCQGEISGDIMTENPVNTSIPGLYTVTYTVSDSAGNAAEATRIVIVTVSADGLCEAVSEVIQAEWGLLAADLGLNPNIVAAPGHRIPERWALAMVRQILCRPFHPHHAAVIQAYLHNLAALEDEPVAVGDRVDPYKHVLAGLLLVNQARQNHFKSLLGLTNDYLVAHGHRRGGDQEIFGDDGDLDGDGITNADEYDAVVSSGGGLEDFANVVIAAALALGILVTLAVFLGLLALGVITRNRRSSR